MDNNLASIGLDTMHALEIEEEISSLFDETIGRGNLRKRTLVSMDGLQDPSSTGFRGFLRTKTAFVIRNACLLAALGFLVFVFLDFMDREVEGLPMDDKGPRGIHQLGFGGDKNPASAAGQQAHQIHDDNDLHDIPESNVGQHVESQSIENSLNHIGHYWHDPNASVFSSPLYEAFTPEELAEKQTNFLKKLNLIREKYGAWNFSDLYANPDQSRPRVDFNACPNRDCNASTFPPGSWQTDQAYVRQLIPEARNLLNRVREGIYEEYGHSSFNDGGTQKSDEEIGVRNKIFQVLLDQEVNDQNIAIDKETNETLLGVAQLSNVAWDGLVTKLLHAMITNDVFYVVVVGDGTAAGHGNNFFQSPVMQFHYLMEPVLDILGIQLLSRNMAVNGMSSVFGAMAGGDIFGEVDLLWYDSRSGVDTKGVKDLLYKQMILSGRRVPVMLTNDPVNLWMDSNKTAWLGNLQPNDAICGTQKTRVCDLRAHNSVCWVPRVDVTPSVTQDSSIREKSFPGNFEHQLEARKLSMLVLHALDSALERWLYEIKDGVFPLSDSSWHVGPRYDRIREYVRVNPKQSECELMLKRLSGICHIEMHGYSEWTPRVTPNTKSLRAILPAGMDVTSNLESEVYSGIDLMPPQWEIPDTMVDPHLIAISTTFGSERTDDNESSDGDDYTSSHSQDLHQETKGDSENVGHPLVRRLDNSTGTLIPGKGWITSGIPVGFCDGSAQSTCGRNNHTKCLMAGHNDYQAGILGDGLSGWLFLKLQNVREGIILAHIDTDVTANSDKATQGWRSENGESEGGDERYLALSTDFWFDYSINGKVKTLNRTQFLSFGMEVDGVMKLYPLLFDESSFKTRKTGTTEATFDVGIRIRTPSSQGRMCTMVLTHLYYA